MASDVSTIDQQFVEFIVKSLVGNPDAVQVERRIDEKGVLLELTVDAEDLGRVIGKRGATAQSLRTLLRALGTKNDARYNLKIIDNGDGGGSHGYGSSAPPTSSSAANDQDDEGEASAGKFEEGVAEEAEPAASDAASRTRQELADLDDLDV